jgi:putative transposase
MGIHVNSFPRTLRDGDPYVVDSSTSDSPSAILRTVSKSILVAKRQTSVGNFTDTVVSLYTRGMTTREIEEHVKESYGIEISPQFISRATEQLQQQITDWQNRPLERLSPVVFVDGLRVSVRTDKGVLKKCVYTVLGVGVSGKQEVLGLWIEETEGARFWLKVLNDLKARGIEDILILCGDGLTGLPEAVVSVFPATDVQLCVVHEVRNCTKFVSYKDRKSFCASMRPKPQNSRCSALTMLGASVIRCRSLPGAITGTA